jgi:hypothetical protein
VHNLEERGGFVAARVVEIARLREAASARQAWQLSLTFCGSRDSADNCGVQHDTFSGRNRRNKSSAVPKKSVLHNQKKNQTFTEHQFSFTPSILISEYAEPERSCQENLLLDEEYQI